MAVNRVVVGFRGPGPDEWLCVGCRIPKNGFHAVYDVPDTAHCHACGRVYKRVDEPKTTYALRRARRDWVHDPLTVMAEAVTWRVPSRRIGPYGGDRWRYETMPLIFGASSLIFTDGTCVEERWDYPWPEAVTQALAEAEPDLDANVPDGYTRAMLGHDVYRRGDDGFGATDLHAERRYRQERFKTREGY